MVVMEFPIVMPAGVRCIGRSPRIAGRSSCREGARASSAGLRCGGSWMNSGFAGSLFDLGCISMFFDW